MSRGSVWALVLAGGSGGRFGGPKHLEDLGGRCVAAWSAEAAAAVTDAVVLVCDPAFRPPADVGAAHVVAGGATRSASVRAGLAVVPDDVEVVIVHDAARPLAPASLFAAVVAAVRSGADGAIPGLAVTDTLKRVSRDANRTTVAETIDRHDLVAVQTPQAFRTAALRKAHAGGGDATDDAALVEAAGGTVVVVPGDPRNLKITVPADLVTARGLVTADGLLTP